MKQFFRENHRLTINLKPFPRRLLWLAIMMLLILWGLRSLYDDFLGRTLAALYKDAQGLQEAMAYLPNEPEVHRQLGWLYLYDPLSRDQSRALGHFRSAVEQSPFDFTLWIDLGRAYEQQGSRQLATEAYRRAMELAPTYFRPHWIYANFLLRSDQLNHALDELVALADKNPDALANTFDLIWQATDGDAGALIALGTKLKSDRSRAALVGFLAARQKYSEARAIWDQLPADIPLKLDSGTALIAKLMAAKQWEQAQIVWEKILQIRYGPTPESERAFWNGGLEPPPLDAGFDWRIVSTPQVEAVIDDTTAQSGRRSLRLRFREHVDVHFSGVSHLFRVKPSTSYRLQFYYRTEGMLARHGVSVQVIDAEQPARLRVHSDSLENESAWTLRQITFQTLPETRVVMLQILREPTGILHDYVAGSMWFDSFSLHVVR